MKSLNFGSVMFFFAFLALTMKAAIPIRDTFENSIPVPKLYLPSVTHSGQSIQITLTLQNPPNGVTLAVNFDVYLLDGVSNTAKNLTIVPDPLSGITATFSYVTKATDDFSTTWFIYPLYAIGTFPFAPNAILANVDTLVDNAI
jgi:hypothetical protein